MLMRFCHHTIVLGANPKPTRHNEGSDHWCCIHGAIHEQKERWRVLISRGGGLKILLTQLELTAHSMYTVRFKLFSVTFLEVKNPSLIRNKRSTFRVQVLVAIIEKEKPPNYG